MTRALLATVALVTASFAASAQDFPRKPIRIIVPFAAGGVVDPIARNVADGMQREWGQTAFVENRPGGSAVFGSDIVAKADHDGHTILITTRQHTITPSFRSKLPYDTVKDFAPVTMISRGDGEALVVRKDFPADTLQEYIDYAKANPGKVTYGSAGYGNILHICGELFSVQTGVRLNHIPFTGSAAPMQAVLGGHVDSFFAPLSVSSAHIKSGAIKALGYTALRRHPDLPDVPTMDELGIPGLKGFEVYGWEGVFVGGKTPPDVVQKIYTTIKKLLDTPEVRAREAKIGLNIVLNTPAEFAETVRKDLIEFETIVEKAGLKKD